MNKDKDPQFNNNKEVERKDEGTPRAQSGRQEEAAKGAALKFFGEIASREKILKAGKRAVHVLQNAAAFVLDFFHRKDRTIETTSEGFDPQKYLEGYYAPLDVVLAARIFSFLDSVLDPSNIREEVEIKHIIESIFQNKTIETEVAEEAIENYLIYYFAVRFIIPIILRERPDDHLKVLDVGGGPSIYPHIPMLLLARSICHAEYLESNRALVRQWKENTLDFDWGSYFDTLHALVKENPSAYAKAMPDVQEKIRKLIERGPRGMEDELRNVLDPVVPADVYQKGLGIPEDDYDVANLSRTGSIELASSYFCLEGTTASIEKWKEGMENVLDKIAPGGFFVMTCVTNATWYMVGDHKIEAVPVTERMIQEELEAHSFSTLKMLRVIGSNQADSWYDGMVMVLAQKSKES